jgi:hypothetical protein
MTSSSSIAWWYPAGLLISAPTKPGRIQLDRIATTFARAREFPSDLDWVLRIVDTPTAVVRHVALPQRLGTLGYARAITIVKYLIDAGIPAAASWP